MAIEFIDLKTQYQLLKEPIQAGIDRVLNHGQFIMGPEVAELELRLAEYVGVKYCVTVSDGTTALLVAMMSLGIKTGDEVITTPFTFIATGEMIALLGAKPVFVDIDPRTYNIDPTLIESKITPRTRAIMPVSLYGQCADFDSINSIAGKYGLAVIEDGAQSFGATFNGRRSCGLSTIGCTSFFPSKPLGCYGDGGACFTDDHELAFRMRQIRLHGQDRRYHHPILGLNGRMDTLQAAILLSKMSAFPEEVVARERIGARYTELLNKLVVVPYVEPFNNSVYAQYTIKVDDRENVQTKLESLGIPTAIHYPVPLNLQPVFGYLKQSAGTFPVAESVASKVISLPMHPYLTRAHQDQIVDSVRQVCSSLHVRNAFPDELINRSTLHGGHGPETSGACK